MGVRVLLVEDEALIALSLADLLEAEGHDVVLARTAPRPWTRRGGSGTRSARW